MTPSLAFCAKKTLEKDNNDFQNLVNSGLTTEQAVANLRTDRIPPTVFTRKAVVDEIFIRKSSNLCKSIVGIDAS